MNLVIVRFMFVMLARDSEDRSSIDIGQFVFWVGRLWNLSMRHLNQGVCVYLSGQDSSFQFPCFWNEHTNLAIQKAFFRLPHKVNLVEDLEPVGRRDLATYVLTGLPEFVCRDSVRVSQLAQNMD